MSEPTPTKNQASQGIEERGQRDEAQRPLHAVHGGEREGEVTATGSGFRLPARGTKHLWQKFAYVAAYCIYVPGSALAFRAVRVERKIPREGAALLLANHTSVMDPAWVMFHSWRMDAHFMASSTLFNIPILGKLIQALGAFPKAKQVKDRGAMAMMTELYDRGGIIMMFPEGERTWDGRTVQALPGIGRLLGRRHYKVITARNLTGYFFQPRWAKYPRWVPISIEYDEPISYSEEMTAEEINADITRRITVDMRGRRAPRFSFGFRMAHGLPGFLWACPLCFEVEGLKVHPRDGNAVCCSGCDEVFKVDVSAWMHPQRAGGPGIPVYEAYDRIVEALPAEVIARGRHSPDGQPVVLETENATLLKMIKKGSGEPVAQGTAQLVPSELRIVGADGQYVWRAPIAEMVAVNLDVGSQLFLRHENHLLRLDCGDESRVKWAHFIRQYHPKYQGVDIDERQQHYS